MTNRVGAGGLHSQNPFGAQWGGKSGQVRSGTIGQQMQKALFGKPKPPVLDPAQFPGLAGRIVLLNRYKKKLATMAGDEEDDYEIVLADGTIASIDEEGQIYMGAAFLEEFGDDPEVLIGALAHEIGHRPKRWKAYQMMRDLADEEMDALCREEEAKADTFAGMALAEMDLDCEPLIEFLADLEDGPHPEYFPAKIRGEIIRDANQSRRFRADFRKKMFPGVDRMTSPKNHLGDY